MKRVVCRAVRTTLAARVLDTGAPPGPLQGHIASCLRCQAVTAQSRRLRRTLADLELAEQEALPESAARPVGWVAAGVASVAAAVVVARLRQQNS